MGKMVPLLLMLSTVNAFSQSGLDEMIAAEKNFAAYAVAHTTGDAFLKFMDTGAVVFDQGAPVNGYRLWQAKKPSAGILNWRPRFAEVAASGDFGYTCGPWTFQPKTVADSIAGSGYFFTVWQKKGDEWKFIYDGGTDTGPQVKEREVIKVTTAKMKGSLSDMLEAENNFTNRLVKDRSLAYKKFLSAASVLCRNTSGLATTSADQKEFIIYLPAGLRYQALGYGMAPTGDLGYTYGNSYIGDKKDFYFHVWRRETEGWKLAVEMVR